MTFADIKNDGKCIQSGCDEKATVKYQFPGTTGEYRTCVNHANEATNLASILGYTLEIEPIE